MPLQIPVQPVPSQQIACVLDGQNCQIAIYQKGGNVFVDLNSNGVDMCIACLALNGVPLDSCNSYDGFSGNLYFIDTQGLSDPQYTGMGTRWVLIYLTAAEVLLAEILPVGVPATSVFILATTLEVTAPAPSNFSVAHDLLVVPSLIEIVPSSGGSIWAQTGFADGTNVNLAGSDTGVTATVRVYTLNTSNLNFNVPAQTLGVESTEPGNFSVAHALGAVPSLLELLPTSAGAIWTQDSAYDATHVYLTASDASVTATLTLFAPIEGLLNIAGPAANIIAISEEGGDFSIPHGLSAVPSRIEILMVSAGTIWAQTPAFDSANIYLRASDGGVIARILVYA